jgi:hypothetical protein
MTSSRHPSDGDLLRHLPDQVIIGPTQSAVCRTRSSFAWRNSAASACAVFSCSSTSKKGDKKTLQLSTRRHTKWKSKIVANALPASRVWASTAAAYAMVVSCSDTKSTVSMVLRHYCSRSASRLSSPRADWGVGCGDAKVPTPSTGKRGARRCTMEIALYKGEASRSLE